MEEEGLGRKREAVEKEEEEEEGRKGDRLSDCRRDLEGCLLDQEGGEWVVDSEEIRGRVV